MHLWVKMSVEIATIVGQDGFNALYKRSVFIADAMIVQRYIEISGSFRRVLSVAKVRGSAHSKELRLFDITDDGIVLGAPLSGYSGILSGRPRFDVLPCISREDGRI